MDSTFPELSRVFGFGVMRPPKKDNLIDREVFTQMVDTYIAAGFRYFDTSRVYVNGDSERAIGEVIASRYPRSSFVLTDKLTSSTFETEEEIPALFESQLKACGVDYFDFYLIHSVSHNNYEKIQNCHCFEFAQKMKQEGKAHHIGFSFHDTPEFLEKVLQDHPEVEVVQIQFNFVDYESSGVQSRRCYEVCRKYGKPVFVMEPIRGGALARVTPKAQELLTKANRTAANLAIRFAAGFDGIAQVLSGMTTPEQVEENVGFMKDFRPLDEEEQTVLWKLRDILILDNGIPCTDCRYCVPGCPQQIAIPDIFKAVNTYRTFHDWQSGWVYRMATKNGGSATDCIHCGQCEEICPQHLPIRQYLEEAAASFSKEED